VVGTVLALGLALTLLWPQPAHAYIDAGTGGLIIQLLLAGLAGLGVVIKMYWRKLAGYFSRREK